MNVTSLPLRARLGIGSAAAGTRRLHRGTSRRSGPRSAPRIPRRNRRIGISQAASDDAVAEITENARSSSDDTEASKDECVVVFGSDGEPYEVMCHDYGFRTGTGRLYQVGYGEIPKNVWELAIDNFKIEYKALRKSLRFDDFQKISKRNPAEGPLGKLGYWVGSKLVQWLANIDKTLEERELVEKINTQDGLSNYGSENGRSGMDEMRQQLKQLKLCNDAIWDRERAREKRGGGVETSLAIKIPYYFLCYMLDALFNNRPLQRFWFLEVVARMPYFSYISMLHFYESLGWWRAGADVRKIHFAEEWNELHHLQIMESLGGDQLWIDRFLANHAAIAYYWILILFYFVSPKSAYNFSELIEAHAVDTYGEFVDCNEELLKSLPPPSIAVMYYKGTDLYMFDDFQTTSSTEPRRPPCNNLYDVFCNIRDDEGEHVKTMKACQDSSIVDELKERRDLGSS